MILYIHYTATRSASCISSEYCYTYAAHHFQTLKFDHFLADRTATQYDRLLAAACCPSVCPSVHLSVMLCILTLRVGVRG